MKHGSLMVHGAAKVEVREYLSEGRPVVAIDLRDSDSHALGISLLMNRDEYLETLANFQSAAREYARETYETS